MPHPSLKIGLVLNLVDSKYSLWKINVANSGFGFVWVFYSIRARKPSYTSSENRGFHSQQNVYGHPISEIYLRRK